ncbi:hypothetical protein BRC91_02990 [Halobacteriales archaeon QS_4_62_28]|nr:MAG: hypothetical protein BRC91_02990 [Halobacteriales archaeon QS_4_62_28]
MTDDQSVDRTDERDRDVVVPLRVYKTITVFSTLFSVVSVVGGFILIDWATNRATLPASQVDPVGALAGIGLILFGAAVYAFATRFRTEEMGKSKDDADEASGNG